LARISNYRGRSRRPLSIVRFTRRSCNRGAVYGIAPLAIIPPILSYPLFASWCLLRRSSPSRVITCRMSFPQPPLWPRSLSGETAIKAHLRHLRMAIPTWCQPLGRVVEDILLFELTNHSVTKKLDSRQYTILFLRSWGIYMEWYIWRMDERKSSNYRTKYGKSIHERGGGTQQNGGHTYNNKK
jgi:hypothetical protein